MITTKEISIFLINSCPTLEHFKSYMFGSSLSGIGTDYDILIVGPAGHLLSRLKVEMNEAGEELPLDVLYMLEEEAEETRFVLQKSCVTLKELAGIQ